MLLPQYNKLDIDPVLARRLLAVAEQAADAASVPTMSHFRQMLDVENKEQPGKFDPVTIADKDAETAIKKVVLEAFPEHGFFGEESERSINTNQLLWIVDPIDGTRAYITGSPLWGTLIAVYDGADVVLGMLEQPYMHERFIGTAFGANARKTELINRTGRSQISTRQGVKLKDAVLQTTAPEMFDDPALGQVFEKIKSSVSMVRFGGDCYCYALLAIGLVDIVIEAKLAPYDIAALIPIIEGAGGVITDWTGNSAASGGSVLACGSKQLHEEVLSRMHST